VALRGLPASGHLKFEHPTAFWVGIVTAAAGILAQLPMFYDARRMHYQLAGMGIPAEMSVGMVMIVAGSVLAAYGVYPVNAGRDTESGYLRFRVSALDDAPIRPAHVALLFTLTFAIIIDIMKPTTLSFVAPGAELEYHLRGPLLPHVNALPIALYPLAGITGTVIGSILWGGLSDRVGRRAALLLADIIFIASSTCGTMPAYWLNLLCCLLMGIGAGGLLPIAVTLLSESVPSRHRGWLMVLVCGGGAGLAYVTTSWLSATIGAPDHFGWRIMWLIGLPTGLVLILLNRWIPESPRFLLAQGRRPEAEAVLKRYNAVLVEDDHGGPEIKDRYSELFRSPFLVLSVCVVLCGLSIGLLQYGFQQWIPSNLEKLGYSAVNASTILRNSSLWGLPLSVPVALLYGFWSSRKTVALLILLNLAAMLAFALGGVGLLRHKALTELLLVIPTWSVGLLASVLAVYAVEIYPTVNRSRGGGLAAGATKLGGVLILALAATAFAAPSVASTAVIALVPMALALVVIIRYGPETSRRTLEQISTDLQSPRVRSG
jgi:putative MFS transporter